MSFFEVNLDYVYFLSGLSLVCLGAAAALLVIERERTLRWLALAVFGIGSGLSLWSAAAVMDLGDTPVFGWGRLVLRVVALAALFEFGRGSLRKQSVRIAGPMLTVGLAAAVVMSGLMGLPSADTVLRFALGIPGGALATWAIALAGHRFDGSAPGIAGRAGRMLTGTAVFMALYTACEAIGSGIAVGTRAAAVWIGPVPLHAIVALAALAVGVEILGFSAAQQFLRGEIPTQKQAFRRFHAVPVMIVVALAGGFAVTQASVLADRDARTTLLQRALTTAAAVDADHVDVLTGARSDAALPEYVQVLAELEHMHVVNKDIRFIYLVRRIDGRVVPLADSAATGSSGLSRPRSVYAQSSPQLEAMLGGGSAGLVEGPLTDAFGTWVSALAPIRDEAGALVAVLGMDVSADEWTLSLAGTRATAIALILVASMMVLGAMATVQVAFDTRHRIASSEARLRSILAIAPEGIAILDPVSRRIEFANPTLSTMLGVPTADLVGTQIDTILAEGDEGACTLSAFGLADASERRLLAASGAVIDVDMTCMPAVIEDKDRLLVFAHDITTRKIAERELQERITLENIVRAVSSRFLTAGITEVDGVVLEALGSLGAVLDVDRVYLGAVTPQGAATRTHEWCSPGTPRQANVVRSLDLNGFPWFYGKLAANEFIALSTIDDLPEEATADRAIMLSQGVLSRVVIPLVENEVLTGYLGIDTVREARRWSGERVALLTVFADVLAAALRRSRAEAEVAKLTLAVTNSPAATVITDANGTIEYVNPRFQELSGYSADELMGANPRVLKSGLNGPEVYDDLWRVITSGGDWHGEFVNRRKDGTSYAVSASISPVRDAKGAVHFVGVQEDITALKVAEVALRSAADVANAANRAKSEFLASMSHEIRTPMNAIIGMGELLEETDLTEEQHRYIRIFRSAGEALLTLINDILDLSKIEAGHFEVDLRPFEVEPMVEETAEVLAIRAREKGLDLLVDIDPATPPRVVGDPDRLRQVLVNLVGNAVKFTSEGHVVISVAPDRSAADPVLRFMVTDTGIGIPTEKLEKIFEAFTQADSSTTRRYGGTGLGLTISRRLTGLMGGSLRVASEEGKGSSFSFTIPLAEASPDAAVETDEAQAELTGVRALIVDDNDTNRLILRRYLEYAGATVDEAAGGEEGLDAMRAASPRFDIVLTDLRMPGMSGFDVAQAISNDPGSSSTRVVVVSSDARPGDDRRARDAGAAALLVKPVRRRALLDAVATACRPTGPSAEPFVAMNEPLVTPEKPLVDTPVEAMNILLVEDTDDNRLLALAYMKSTPHRVVTAVNGMEAVEQYKSAGAGGFDMVLMDLQMPVMDGYAATREIRRVEAALRWPHVPVVALTAYALADETTAALKAGCDDYLTKPIKKATLLDAVARHSGA